MRLGFNSQAGGKWAGGQQPWMLNSAHSHLKHGRRDVIRDDELGGGVVARPVVGLHAVAVI